MKVKLSLCLIATQCRYTPKHFQLRTMLKFWLASCNNNSKTISNWILDFTCPRTDPKSVQQINIFSLTENWIGPGRAVCIETHSGLDDPGIKSWRRRNFLQPSRPALGPAKPPVIWVPGLFPRSESAEVWLWPTDPSSSEVKQRLELDLYSPSEYSWPVLGRYLPFAEIRIPILLLLSLQHQPALHRLIYSGCAL
jgi:hypothetical protein